MISIPYKNHTIEIEPMDDIENPRDSENLGTMVLFHKRYTLGDKHNIDFHDYQSWHEMKRNLIKTYGAKVILPVYMYDHSGISISTIPFSCRWDSGQVGFIYVSTEQIKKNFYCEKRISKNRIAKIEKLLQREVVMYDYYLNGDCYQFETKNAEGIVVDGACGSWGSDFIANGLLETAQQYIDAQELQHA